MTQPVQEPTPRRTDSALGFGQRQLQRRPATPGDPMVEFGRVDAGAWAYTGGPATEHVEFVTLETNTERFTLETDFGGRANQLTIDPGGGFYAWEIGTQYFEGSDSEEWVLEAELNNSRLDGGVRNIISSKQGLNDFDLIEDAYFGLNHFVNGAWTEQFKADTGITTTGWFAIFEADAYTLELRLRFWRDGAVSAQTIENPYIAIYRIGAAGELLPSS